MIISQPMMSGPLTLLSLTSHPIILPRKYSHGYNPKQAIDRYLQTCRPNRLRTELNVNVNVNSYHMDLAYSREISNHQLE